LSKPNWSCSDFGMSSGRRESVLRHIKNPHIHNGRAIPIPFVEYVARRQLGFYPPNSANNYLRRKIGHSILNFMVYVRRTSLASSKRRLRRGCSTASPTRWWECLTPPIALVTRLSTTVNRPSDRGIITHTEEKMYLVLGDTLVLNARS
jgi:hypothetical protein